VANDEVCLLLQAETVTALKNLEAICAVDGVHGVFIGPADPAAGTLTSDPALARRYLDLGCTFVAVGVDMLMFVNAARRLRGQFAGAGAAPAASGPSAAY